jgi:hypothetical protein
MALIDVKRADSRQFGHFIFCFLSHQIFVAPMAFSQGYLSGLIAGHDEDEEESGAEDADEASDDEGLWQTRKAPASTLGLPSVRIVSGTTDDGAPNELSKLFAVEVPDADDPQEVRSSFAVCSCCISYSPIIAI